MRKRFVTTLILCLAALITAVCFAACSPSSNNGGDGKDDEKQTVSVAGKTYVHDRTYLEFDETVSQEKKDQFKEYEEGLNQMEDVFITFNADGTLLYHFDETLEMTGTYTEKDGVITTLISGESATITRLDDGRLETRKDLGEVGFGGDGVTQVSIMKEKAE